MARSGAGARIVLAPAARRDLREALIWSEQQFGAKAAARYQELLAQALRDVAADPERPGSRERPELGRAVRSFHLWFSRGRAGGALGAVKRPRHFLIYRWRDGGVIDVLRVLHDARELARHMPGAEEGV